jgi:2'-5' RNA ligase
VIWAGVAPLQGALAQAQTIAEKGARAIGLKPEKRAFRPHLTLARIRDVRQTGDLPERLSAERDFEAGSFSVSSVSLFYSELTRSGPIYQRIQEFQF